MAQASLKPFSQPGTGEQAPAKPVSPKACCGKASWLNNQAPTGNAPCWIRTSDRLLRRQQLVDERRQVTTGLLGSRSARCEQKCEQFAEEEASARLRSYAREERSGRVCVPKPEHGAGLCVARRDAWKLHWGWVARP